MNQALLDLLVDCCVQVRGKSRGAGFFVAPSLILTCAHVIGLNAEIGSSVSISYGGQTHAAKVVAFRADEDDLALLECEVGETSHPCAYLLGEEMRLGDRFFGYGFPKYTDGDSISGICEGKTHRIGSVL